jgi:hypothetical protein
MLVLRWESDQCDVPEEWFILSTMPEKDTREGLSTTAWSSSQLLAAAQIKLHMGLSFDNYFPTEIGMSSISPMIDALTDGVTKFPLQMRCDRRNSLPPEQKQQEDQLLTESTSLRNLMICVPHHFH